jgi:predicted NBD/HSP70 family sugar kinase
VKSRVALRSLLAGVALTAVLTGCGASAPPADELANEIIDTLENNGVPVSDEIKACMHTKVDEFALTEEEAQGFENLDDVAKKADAGNEQAIQIMQRFEDALASCNP